MILMNKINMILTLKIVYTHLVFINTKKMKV